MNISVVIPIYNEAENIAALHHEVVKVCIENDIGFEIIFVDDCSTDQTQMILKGLFPVKVVQFRRQFGQTAALDAGIKASKYDYIVTMDGDRQNDPADIPRLIFYLKNQELDIVSGWRRKREDKFMKRFFSRTANVLRRIILNDGIQDSGCSLKIYKKECFETVNLYGEMHRFIPALLKIQGFKVGEIEVNHRARTAGRTKYKWTRSVKGIIDMFSVWFWKKYAVRPLHLLGGVGLGLFFLSFIFGIITIRDFLRGQDLSDTLWLILTLFTFLIGLLILISGLMMDILIKTYFEKSGNKYYIIKDEYENEGP